MTVSVIVPVITIDGPSGSGKGTIASRVAQALGWHILDSGILYRALAWRVIAQNIALTDVVSIERVAAHFSMDTVPPISELRQERVGLVAAKVASIPVARQAMLVHQRRFRVPPGLVADGRDMGTVVFPDAALKFYLDADVCVRAKRRFMELQAKGNSVTLPAVKSDLRARDDCDALRLQACINQRDMIVMDTSTLSVEEVLAQVMHQINDKGGFCSAPE